MHDDWTVTITADRGGEDWHWLVELWYTPGQQWLVVGHGDAATLAAAAAAAMACQAETAAV